MMLRNLFVICSALFLSSCATERLRVPICISNPDVHGFACTDPDDRQYVAPYDSTKLWLGWDPKTAQNVVNFCKLERKSPEMELGQHKLGDSTSAVPPSGLMTPFGLVPFGEK